MHRLCCRLSARFGNERRGSKQNLGSTLAMARKRKGRWRAIIIPIQQRQGASLTCGPALTSSCSGTVALNTSKLLCTISAFG